MAEVYNEEDYSSGYPPGIENYFWHQARNRLISSELRKLSSADDVILDIGCGPGLVTAYLREHGFNCYGVEQGQSAPSSRMSDHLFPESDALELPEDFRKNVKVIMLLDVLEHIESRETFLQNIVQRYPNCTAILLTVPARMELWSNFDERWGHYLRYDVKTLRAELAQAGLEVGTMRYFFHLLYLAAAALSMSQKSRATQFKSPGTDIVSKCFHTLLGWCFFIEAKVVPGSVVGSSILATTRPKRLA